MNEFILDAVVNSEDIDISLLFEEQSNILYELREMNIHQFLIIYSY